jgi:hypothetical protein
VPFRAKNLHFFAKNSLLPVDGLFPTATLLTPPEAGLPLVARRKELVLAFFWDCKLELNFVPAMMKRPPAQRVGRPQIIAGGQVGFFCGLEEA